MLLWACYGSKTVLSVCPMADAVWMHDDSLAGMGEVPGMGYLYVGY